MIGPPLGSRQPDARLAKVTLGPGREKGGTDVASGHRLGLAVALLSATAAHGQASKGAPQTDATCTLQLRNLKSPFPAKGDFTVLSEFREKPKWRSKAVAVRLRDGTRVDYFVAGCEHLVMSYKVSGLRQWPGRADPELFKVAKSRIENLPVSNAERTRLAEALEAVAADAHARALLLEHGMGSGLLNDSTYVEFHRNADGFVLVTNFPL